MALRFIGFFSLSLVAEVIASSWVWGRAPSDSIRVFYSDFWTFEAGRLDYWIIIFTFLIILWIFARNLFRRYVISKGDEQVNNRPWSLLASWALGTVLTVALEVLTSALYWRSDSSLSLRAFYQAMWFWDFWDDRNPHTNDPGWPSFRIYTRDHFLPWALVLLIGVTLCFFWKQRRKPLVDGA